MTIPTWLHGPIDYGVASVLGGLALCRALAPPVRAALGATGAFNASYSLLTDYEAGLRPVLTMRQHLALDALAGAGLCAAGLLMRRQPAEARALLIAAGLSELAVASMSSATPVSGPGQGSGPVARVLGFDGRASDRASYPPIDTPKPVAEDVFVVDSVLPGAMGAAVAVRMTVIRLPGGDLLLHSPTRYSPGLKAALAALGPIRHLVAPSIAHWTFLRDWQRACPGVTTWAAPGLRERSQVRRSGVRVDRVLSERAPAEWGDAIELATVPGGFGFHEVALFHRPTRTLLLADLVMNLEPAKVPALLRPVARLFGMLAPAGMPPPYLRATIKLRRAGAKRAASRLLGWRPVRVIFAHGRWFERDGTARLRQSLRWLADAPGL